MNMLMKINHTESLKQVWEQSSVLCSICTRSHNFIFYSTYCAFSLQKMSNQKLFASALIAHIIQCVSANVVILLIHILSISFLIF